MPITVIKSSDIGAPTLNGLPGTLITVLDHCLVTTLGWTKEYSGVNKAAYRQPVGTNMMYLQVHDDEAVNSKYARVRGFESMSDVDTGADQFPTNAQAANYYWHKSDANDADACDWAFFSNGDIFYLAIVTPGIYNFFWKFGELDSIWPSDAWATMIHGTGSTSEYSAHFNSYTNSYMAIARNIDGSIKSQYGTFNDGTILTAQSGNTLPHGSYPSVPLQISKRTLGTATSGLNTKQLRASIPGIYSILANYDEGFSQRAVWEDTLTDQDGVTYAFVASTLTTNAICLLVQISGEW